MALRIELIQVILQLSKCRSRDEIIGVLRDTTRALTGADGITVVLRDQEQCFYVEENAIGALWKGRRFPLSACISGWCMIHRQQVVIRDIYADDRIPHDAYRPTFVKSLAMTPIRSADPIGAIGAYWASHHEATQEELTTLQALGDSASMALENAQLIEALQETSRRKDAFLSMLAHELRNPLAPIRNGLHLLQLQGGDADVVGEATEIMHRQVVHLSRIVDDLLDAARVTTGRVVLKRSKLELGALIRKCVTDHRSQFDTAGLSLKAELPVTPLRIDADETRLAQVLANALDNARKYTPSGGSVSLSLSADPSSKTATIVVEDTGVGVAAEVLLRVFEPFTQADASLERTAGGLGLGLAIAGGIVKLHGGSISLKSDGIGRGARLTITLPDVEVAEPPQKTASVPLTGSKKRVSIIEDNLDSAHTLQKLIKCCGFDAMVAYDGCAGLDLARAERPDVVLCDIGLPKMDGYAVASSLRSSQAMANMRLIAVTGYGSDEDRRRSRDAGFDAHLVKPIDLKDLLGHIRETNLNRANADVPFST